MKLAHAYLEQSKINVELSQLDKDNKPGKVIGMLRLTVEEADRILKVVDNMQSYSSMPWGSKVMWDAGFGGSGVSHVYFGTVSVYRDSAYITVDDVKLRKRFWDKKIRAEAELNLSLLRSLVRSDAPAIDYPKGDGIPEKEAALA